MMETVLTGLPFVACVALAALTQNLTGFAFGLVLLGLVGLFDLVPLADAANASSLLTLVHAAVYFGQNRLTPHWRLIRPALWTLAPGVAGGVLLLAWLDSGTLSVLRMLLGLTIVASALMLLGKPAPCPAPVGAAPFALSGALSGLLGGLFASPGPPLVWQMYRQPLTPEVTRQCLLLAFVLVAVLRLLLETMAGRLSSDAVALAATAAPAVAGVNLLRGRLSAFADRGRLRWLVAGLLVATGMVLVLGH